MLRGALRIGTAAILIVCLVWMDVCLYYNIQAIGEPGRGNETNYHKLEYSVKSKKTQPDRDKMISSSSRLRPFHANIDEVPPVPGPDDPHSRLPSMIQRCSFAFRGMSIKLIMSDPIDNYLLGPLADALGDMCNFRDNFRFISANMVSYAGVLSALIAAKLVTHQNSPIAHKLAFLFFQLRTWLDNLDGVVARSRMGITKHVSLQNTSGYVVDGVCDAIGFIAFVFGIYLYLKHSHFLAYRHLKPEHRNDTHSNHRRLLLLIAMFLFQLALCSAGWNIYILKYNALLESPSSNPLESAAKLAILKSNIMFIIAWFWRITNGHLMMQLLSVSVLMGKIWHFLEFIKFIGLVEILILIAITHLHTVDIKTYLTLVMQ
jgi:phosphatidylserine synthase